MTHRMFACSRRVAVLSLAACGLLNASLALAEEPLPQRVITIGGAVTEIAYALGQQDRLVARDTTSNFPPEVEDLPDIGYMRALSPEGVLSLNPDLVVAVQGSGPPETIAVLEAADIPFVIIPEGYGKADVVEKMRSVGAALGVPEQAEALAQKVDAEISQALASAAAAQSQTAPSQNESSQNESSQTEPAQARVLFILSAQGGRIMAAGTGSSAAGMIEMAGGINAVSSFEGYKPMTDEAVALAAPDVILMMDRGGDHDMANDALFALPALATTPAARTRSILRMDGLYLLGFGPRTGAAITTLSEGLSEAMREARGL